MSTRVSRIRKRVLDGKPITDDEKAMVARWNAQKTNKGPKPKSIDTIQTSKDGETDMGETETGEEETDGAKHKDEPSKSQDVHKKEPETLKSSPGMGKPVPSAPPFLKVKTSKGDWREKYRGSASSDSREQTCVQVANQWQQLLVKMARDIKKLEPDSKVWFDETEIREGLYAPMVLTVDKLLPDGFEVGPEVTATVGTSAVVVQRWLVGRRAAKKKIDAQDSVRTAAQYVSQNPGKVVNNKPESPAEAADADVLSKAMEMGDVPPDYEGPM